jgi:hypothetical protein
MACPTRPYREQYYSTVRLLRQIPYEGTYCRCRHWRTTKSTYFSFSSLHGGDEYGRSTYFSSFFPRDEKNTPVHPPVGLKNSNSAPVGLLTLSGLHTSGVLTSAWNTTCEERILDELREHSMDLSHFLKEDLHEVCKVIFNSV